MPGGTAELPILFKGHSSVAVAKGPGTNSPEASPQLRSTSPSMFGSILRFLHLEAGLPRSALDDECRQRGGSLGRQNSATPTDRGRCGTANDEPRSTTSNRSKVQFDDEENYSAKSLHSLAAEQEEGGSSHSSPVAATAPRSRAHDDNNNAVRETKSGRFRNPFSSLFSSNRRKKSKSPVPRKGPTASSAISTQSRAVKQSRQVSSVAEEDFLASSVILEGDEDEDRNDLAALEAEIFNILVLNFHSELKVLKEKTIWVGGEVTETQMHTIIFFFFRQMKMLLSQQFSQIFPLGIHGTALSMPDVAASVAALCLVEMAITDDDVHSFAFSVFKGHRISLSNCPPSKRYLYFMFMAFKSTVPTFRFHMEQFRASVARYFYDRNSIKMATNPFVMPLQALLNVLAPLMFSPLFQKFTPAFYYYALNLEKERSGRAGDLLDDEDEEEEEFGAQSMTTPRCAEAHSNSDVASNNLSSPLVAVESPESTKSLHMVRQKSSSMKFSASQSAVPARTTDQWSTIAFSYRKAASEVIGQGAYGTVYRCYDASNGTFYALKEISLMTTSLKRRLKQRSLQMRNPTGPDVNPAAEDAQKSRASTTEKESHPGLEDVTLAQLLTEKERAEIRARESSICGEINMLKTLRHPYIVSYYGCSFDRKRLKVSILMEYCPKTLRNIIDDVGALPLPMIAHYAKQVLLGLAFLHDNHVVHRDIKAANILVKDGGEAKVSDFGTAVTNDVLSEENGNNVSHALEEEFELHRKQFQADRGEDLRTLFTAGKSSRNRGNSGKGKANLTQHDDPTNNNNTKGSGLGMIQGTPLFLAPEVANGCLPTESSDLWSFGCLLIEMATGEYPWHEWTEGRQDIPLEMIVFHIGFSSTPPPLDASLAAEASANELFVSFVGECLKIDPCSRPTARALLSHPFFSQDFGAMRREVSGDDDDAPAATVPSSQGLTNNPILTTLEADSDVAGALNSHVLSIIPNDSMVDPSGVF